MSSRRQKPVSKMEALPPQLSGIAPGSDTSSPPPSVIERRLTNPMYYASYLHVSELLSLQTPRSAAGGRPAAHDEMLFIITHQAYELWFKQIIHELDSVRAMFSTATVDERDMGVAVSRLQRVNEIQLLLVQQISVLETMSALEFLAFRDYLYPASGFQSVQLCVPPPGAQPRARARPRRPPLLTRPSHPPAPSRLVENKLGLRAAQRLSYGGRTGYCSVLSEADAATVAAAEAEPSLFSLVEAWLERTPFLEWTGPASRSSSGGGGGGGGAATFSFWAHYRDAVEAMLAADEASLKGFTSTHAPATLEAHAKDLAAQRAHFETLLDPEKYAESVARGERRLSHRAMQAALFITLFQREPGLQLPYRLLSALLSMDEQLCAWRARHAQMVHRMLGAKLGTGGSSGYSYLKATVERHRIFTDLFNIATFLLPETAIPPLPAELRARLGFAFSAGSPRAAGSAPGTPQAPPPAARPHLHHPPPGEGAGGVCPMGFH